MTNITIKKLLTFLSIIIFISGLLLFSSCIEDNKPSSSSKPPAYKAFLKEWMDYIDDDVLIRNIVMPGSHDAASYGMMSYAETQSSTIYEQLIMGVRYFDLRVRLVQGRLVIHHGLANGDSLLNVFKDIKKYVKEYPSQFFILDIRYEGDIALEISELIKENLDIENDALPASTRVGNLTMGSARETATKYAIIMNWGLGSAEGAYYHSAHQSIISPYNSQYHIYEFDYLIKNGFPVYFSNNINNRLFVLQAQRTANPIENLKKLENRFKPYINDYLDKLNDQEIIDKLNIIMRDYVDTDINNLRLILKFNIEKNLIIDDKLEEYKDYLALMVI